MWLSRETRIVSRWMRSPELPPGEKALLVDNAISSALLLVELRMWPPASPDYTFPLNKRDRHTALYRAGRPEILCTLGFSGGTITAWIDCRDGISRGITFRLQELPEELAEHPVDEAAGAG